MQEHCDFVTCELCDKRVDIDKCYICCVCTNVFCCEAKSLEELAVPKELIHKVRNVYDMDTRTCSICRGENLPDKKLLKFVLESQVLAPTREELVKLYFQERVITKLESFTAEETDYMMSCR